MQDVWLRRYTHMLHKPSAERTDVLSAADWWRILHGSSTRSHKVVGSIPTLGMVRFWSLGNFIYPNLPQYTQLQMSTNIVGKVPAMD